MSQMNLIRPFFLHQKIKSEMCTQLRKISLMTVLRHSPSICLTKWSKMEDARAMIFSEFVTSINFVRVRPLNARRWAVCVRS